MSANRVLRRISGNKEEKVKRRARKLHIVKFHNVNSALNIIRRMKYD
jgi:hypothetical protein